MTVVCMIVYIFCVNDCMNAYLLCVNVCGKCTTSFAVMRLIKYLLLLLLLLLMTMNCALKMTL